MEWRRSLSASLVTVTVGVEVEVDFESEVYRVCHEVCELAHLRHTAGPGALRPGPRCASRVLEASDDHDVRRTRIRARVGPRDVLIL